jgi:endonuclease YncB( thermonuclease family)
VETPTSRFVAALFHLVVTALTASVQELLRVKRVIDGDTIILESGERVRRLGVNTPETKHPTKKVEAFDKGEAEFSRRLVEESSRWSSTAANGNSEMCREG